jgi:hypothetical protein
MVYPYSHVGVHRGDGAHHYSTRITDQFDPARITRGDRPYERPLSPRRVQPAESYLGGRAPYIQADNHALDYLELTGNHMRTETYVEALGRERGLSPNRRRPALGAVSFSSPRVYLLWRSSAATLYFGTSTIRNQPTAIPHETNPQQHLLEQMPHSRPGHSRTRWKPAISPSRPILLSTRSHHATEPSRPSRRGIGLAG